VSEETGEQMDSMLLPFLLSSDESEADNLLADLLSGCAVPGIESIVRSMFGGPAAREINYGVHQQEDIEDLVGEIYLKILRRLRGLKQSPNEDTIKDFRSYVAVTTYNTCTDYVRVKYPNWYGLKKKLRYALAHDPDFAIWEGTGRQRICGLAQWRGQERLVNCGWINEARMNTDWCIQRGPADDVIDLLRAVFTSAKAPILLEDLVSLVAGILRIAVCPDGNEVQLEYLKPAQLPAGYIDPVYKQWQRECVNLLWNEIVQLPVRQRVAVLLAARDDGHSSVILIFSEICIASIREIARAVGMSANEFAQILPKLPLDDNAIGKHLGVDRRRVITSRLSARRRLVRRMKSTD